MFFNKKGMTLIELMIVVAIVGILASVAVVVYSNVRSKGYVTEAKQALMTIYQEQENYRAEHGTYATNPSDLPFFKKGHPQTVGQYSVDLTLLNPNEFRAKADPDSGKMAYKANDKYTGWLEIYATDGVMTKSSQHIANDWP